MLVLRRTRARLLLRLTPQTGVAAAEIEIVEVAAVADEIATVDAAATVAAETVASIEVAIVAETVAAMAEAETVTRIEVPAKSEHLP